MMMRTCRMFFFVLAAVLLVAATASAQTNCSGVPAWAPNTSYATGALVTYGGIEYKCIQGHTSQTGWEPPNVPALWGAVGSCTQSTPTPTPTPKITPTPTPTPKITPTPTPTPTPILICGEPAWNVKTSYPRGALVGFNAFAWDALVANKGVKPGTNGKVWAMLARPCPTAPPPTPTPTPTPTATPTPNPKVYAVTDVGSYGGTTTAYGVNDQGHVVGISGAPRSTATPVGDATPAPTPGPMAFVSVNGTLTDPCTIHNGAVENARAISIDDVVFGECAGQPFSTYPAPITFFTTPRSMGGVTAAAFEEVGWAETAAGQIHAFLWNGSGTATDLGTLGGYWSYATGISVQGEVVGAAYTADNAQTHAFTWFNGTMTDLGANSYAWAVNGGSRVVGEAGPPTFPANHAFLYLNSMTDLGALAPNASSAAYAINDNEQIVGSSNGHAFLYENGVMTDLNSLIDPALGITLYEARGIANIGYVVANATNGHAYLLTPPSPVPLWKPGVAYPAGQQVYFGGHVYQCLQAHTSAITEEPLNTPALWRLIS